MSDLPDWCSVPEGDWRIWAIVGGAAAERKAVAESYQGASVVLFDIDRLAGDVLAGCLDHVDPDDGCRLIVTAQELGGFLGWQGAVSRSGLFCTITGPDYRGYIHAGMSSIGLTRVISREAIDAALTRDFGL